MIIDDWSFNHFIIKCINIGAECHLCKFNNEIYCDRKIYHAYYANHCVTSIMANILQLLYIVNENNE